MPDTPELQRHFGQPGNQRPGCRFLVAHLLVLFHAGTGLLREILIPPLRSHDMSQVVANAETVRAARRQFPHDRQKAGDSSSDGGDDAAQLGP
jgi:hypothetical protein